MFQSKGDSGPGGNGGFRDNGGQGGYSYVLYDRDSTDAFFATLDQNALAPGTVGTGGTSSESDGSIVGIAGEADIKNWH